MTAFERLINTGYRLEVFKLYDGKETAIGVNFKDSKIKDGIFLVSDYGIGQTFE